MGPLPKRTSSWAGTICSNARTWMRRSAGRQRFRPPSMARSKSARSGRRNKSRMRMTAAAEIETTFRQEHGRVLAALISQLGDFMLAEDALQDAVVNALERWEIDEIGRNPAAWLMA